MGSTRRAIYVPGKNHTTATINRISANHANKAYLVPFLLFDFLVFTRDGQVIHGNCRKKLNHHAKKALEFVEKAAKPTRRVAKKVDSAAIKAGLFSFGGR